MDNASMEGKWGGSGLKFPEINRFDQKIDGGTIIKKRQDISIWHFDIWPSNKAKASEIEIGAEN